MISVASCDASRESGVSSSSADAGDDLEETSLDRRNCSAKRALWKESGEIEGGFLTAHSFSLPSSMKKVPVSASDLSRMAWNGAGRCLWMGRKRRDHCAGGCNDNFEDVSRQVVGRKDLELMPPRLMLGG